MVRAARSIGLAVLASACAPHLYSPAGDDGASDTDLWTAPVNSWSTAAPPAGLVGEGMDEGQVVLDVRGTDQFGAEVSLWQFYGSVVLLDISTLWCGPCQDLAKHAESVYQEYKDQGFVYLTVIHEDQYGRDPSADDLTLWAGLPATVPDGEFDLITAPIIADPAGVSGSIRAVRNGSYPAALVIGRDLKVAQRLDPVSEGTIQSGIEAALQ
jgi:thiol-disulfide isomerase/thioredoxin